MEKIDVNEVKLSNLVSNQLQSLFGVTVNIAEYQDIVLKRIGKCFRECGNKYYYLNEKPKFSPYHSVQYSIYLYYLANTIFRIKGENELSERIYYLNKVMNSVDWYYQIELPDVFNAEHPLSSVMGRATYSNRFFFYQGCTVGGNKGEYPIIGENVIMYANSTIIGDSKVGNNVIISIGTIVKDEIIPDNCIVFGQSPNILIKKKSETDIKDLTKHFWREI